MTAATSSTPMRVVVAHRGARDSYQTARAMQEAGLLERLVTDLYCPGDALARLVPTLRVRSSEGVPSQRTLSCGLSGAVSMALERTSVPFALRQRAIRWADTTIGKRAGRLATRRDCTILSYSYYAHSAFTHYRGSRARILFQMHPHPESVRRILTQELIDHPECEASLLREWELSLPPADFQRLADETRMADFWIAASSFTKQTLVANGASAERIHVAPYGVDLSRFNPGDSARSAPHSGPLRLLFVGTINQRKGIAYLAQALRMFRQQDVELRVCGRVVDDLKLLQQFGSQVRITPSVSADELIQAYRTAELFVFPSVAEGFGHVLLESLACGLPVLSTYSTAAPDLIEEGEQGFVVCPRDPFALASRIEWCLANRERLAQMRRSCRERAEHFTWARFRSRLASVVRSCAEEPARERQVCV